MGKAACGVAVDPGWVWLCQDVWSRGTPLPPAEIAVQHCTPSPAPDPADLVRELAVHGLWGTPVGEESWCGMRNVYEGCCSHETKEAVA